MRKNEYKVYILREVKTGKIVYAGLTRSLLTTRFNSHVCRKKFNRYEYQIEMIQDELSIEQAVELEDLLIKQYNLLKDGWNVSPKSKNGYSNYHSEEMKAKWSKERKGKPVSPEHAKKNKIARLGKKNGEFWKQRISEVKSKPVMCLETGIIYKSIRQAANVLDLCHRKISAVCLGKRKTTGGLHFVYVKKQ